MKRRLIFSLTLVLASPLFAKTITVEPGKSIQAAVDQAKPGDTIEVKPGTYNEGVYIDKPSIRLIGLIENGKWPILDGKMTRNDGIIASGSNFEVMNFEVKNYKGNGVTSQGADDVLMKNLVVENTGLYGVYPTHGTNIIVENTVTSKISDAGIYVAQCTNVDVRNNEVYENVAGIEVENSHHVLVENNYAHDNTGGILAFTLPGLPEKSSGNIIIRNNIVESNNLANFANPGAVVGSVPKGTGILILAGTDVKIENNIIRNNHTSGLIFSDMDYIKDSTAPDAGVNPRFDNNKVLGNLFHNNGKSPDGKVKLLLAALHFRLTGGDLIAYGKGEGNCLHPKSGAEAIGTKAFAKCKDTDTTTKVTTMLDKKASLTSYNRRPMPTGERVYRTVCSGCHASSSIVLIGPSIQEIQKKYKGNPKGIAAFANDPIKMRSKFPLMPAHEYLGKERLQAVAEYMLSMK